MTPESIWLARIDRTVRRLVAIYPPEFPAGLTDDLRLCVRDGARDAYRRRGTHGLVAFTLLAFADLTAAGLAERWRATRGPAAARPGGRRPVEISHAALAALLGGLTWLTLANSVALGLQLGLGNALLLGLAALCFGACLALLGRSEWPRLGSGGHVALGMAMSGAIVPAILGLVRLMAGPQGPFDFMDIMLFLLLGLIASGVALLARRAGHRRVGLPLLLIGCVGLWIGVGDRHGFGRTAMLVPLELFGALWLVVAALLWWTPGGAGAAPDATPLSGGRSAETSGA